MKQVLRVNNARQAQNKQGVEKDKALKLQNAALEEDVERRLEGKIK